MEEQEKAVDCRGLAEILATSEFTIRRRAEAGEIPGMKLGRSWRFIPSAVIAHLSAPSDPWKRSPQSSRGRRKVAA